MPKDIRDAVFDEVYSLAVADQSVLFLTADMGAYSLDTFRKELPGQFINMGIAEQNMVSVAAGMALMGKKVFLYSIIPFVTMRCLEQVKVCLADMNLPVCIIGGGAGFTYGSDGPTHHAIQDVGIIRSLYNVAIYNPCDETSAVQAVRAAYMMNGPSYIRIENGAYGDIYHESAAAEKGMVKLASGDRLYILSTGAMTHRVLHCVGQHLGNAVGVIDVCRLDRLDIELLRKSIGKVKEILTVEEHFVSGGLGSLVEEALYNQECHIQRLGVENPGSIGYGSREWLLNQNGIDEMQLLAKLEQVLKSCV